jgi:F-type H+-transporting ATPase subunit a
LKISPDEIILWEMAIGPFGTFHLNATIVFTWVVMAVLTISAWFVTRHLVTGPALTRRQNILEVLVLTLRDQIRDVSQQEPGPFLPFVGTLFVFIAVSNLLAIIPGYLPPTSSLSTTTALAICVFVAVPIFGVTERGVRGYLSKYLQPTPFMLPFNVISELSRTIALAIRLYGNVMSGTVIVAILIGIAPFFFPIALQLLGLLTGLVQAYIFAVLSMVYIASATVGRSGDTSGSADKASSTTVERRNK